LKHNYLINQTGVRSNREVLLNALNILSFYIGGN